MPIQIVRENERLAFDAGSGCTIYYRRVPGHVESRLDKKNRKRGNLDIGAYGLDLLKYAILDWEGVYDGDESVPFSPGMIQWLPDEPEVSCMTPSSSRLRNRRRTGAWETPALPRLPASHRSDV